MSAFLEYQELQRELFLVRRAHQDCESAEEDDLLDQMDGVWAALTPEERARFNQEPPGEIPGQGESPAGLVLEDVDVETCPGPVRRMVAA